MKQMLKLNEIALLKLKLKSCKRLLSIRTRRIKAKLYSPFILS
jgi:hypothetical protein